MDAALIPSGFLVTIGHDAVQVRRQNLVFIHTQQNNFSSVDTSIQHTYTATNDPRLAFTSTGKIGSDAKTLIVFPNKDATATSVQALAKYSEAQLIIAENDVNTGNFAGALAIVNSLQAANGQPNFNPSPLSAATVMPLVIEERRREFFLEGHRLGDVRRYNLPLNPAAGAPYVSGGDLRHSDVLPAPGCGAHQQSQYRQDRPLRHWRDQLEVPARMPSGHSCVPRRVDRRQLVSTCCPDSTSDCTSRRERRPWECGEGPERARPRPAAALSGVRPGLSPARRLIMCVNLMLKSRPS